MSEEKFVSRGDHVLYLVKQMSYVEKQIEKHISTSDKEDISAWNNTHKLLFLLIGTLWKVAQILIQIFWIQAHIWEQLSEVEIGSWRVEVE